MVAVPFLRRGDDGAGLPVMSGLASRGGALEFMLDLVIDFLLEIAGLEIGSDDPLIGFDHLCTASAGREPLGRKIGGGRRDRAGRARACFVATSQ